MVVSKQDIKTASVTYDISNGTGDIRQGNNAFMTVCQNLDLTKRTKETYTKYIRSKGSSQQQPT